MWCVCPRPISGRWGRKRQLEDYVLNLDYDKFACQIVLDDRPLAYVDLCGTGGIGSRIVYTDYAKEKFDPHELAHAKSVAEQKC